jgi:hypothetical protein
MKNCLMLLVASLFTLTLSAQTRFEVYDLYINPQGGPLAAYQVKIQADRKQVKIISVEGGEHSAFKEAPFFDPLAIQKETIKLAAFSTATANDLPRGRTRVATIHIQLNGTKEPKFKLTLQAAATVAGRPIDATIRLVQRIQE